MWHVSSVILHTIVKETGIPLTREILKRFDSGVVKNKRSSFDLNFTLSDNGFYSTARIEETRIPRIGRWANVGFFGQNLEGKVIYSSFLRVIDTTKGDGG